MNKQQGDAHGHKGVTHLAVSCDGASLFSVGFDQALTISKVAEGAVGTHAVALGSNVSALCAGNKTADLVAAVLTSGLLVLVRGGKIVSKLDTKLKGAAKAAFNADDSELAVAGGPAKKVLLFSISGDEAKESGATADEHNADVTAVAYGPDGSNKEKLLVSASSGYVDVWNDKRDASLSSAWQFHNARINELKFNPAGTVLCSVGSDKAVIFWKDFEKFRPKPDVIQGAHHCGVVHFDWVDDENIITIGDDSTIKKWTITPGGSGAPK